MLDVLLYVLPVIVVIAGAFLLYCLYPGAFPAFLHHAHLPNEGVTNGIGSLPDASISQPKLQKLKPTPQTWINQPNSSCS
jgi:hypothetical protein